MSMEQLHYFGHIYELLVNECQVFVILWIYFRSLWSDMSVSVAPMCSLNILTCFCLLFSAEQVAHSRFLDILLCRQCCETSINLQTGIKV